MFILQYECMSYCTVSVNKKLISTLKYLEISYKIVFPCELQYYYVVSYRSIDKNKLHSQSQ